MFADKNCCLSTPIGLEPTTILSKRYPDSGTIPARAVEGFFLLKSLPGVGAQTAFTIPPMELATDCIEELGNLKQKIMTHATFHAGEPARHEWLEWFTAVTPASPSVTEYIKEHVYLCPLRTFFIDGNYADHRHWSQQLSVARDEIASFTSRIGIALPSVQSTLTPNVPIRPYALVEGGNQTDLGLSDSIQRYINNGAEAAQTLRFSNQFLVAGLVAVIKRRIKQNGHHHATSSKTKAALVEMITELNREFIGTRFKPLELDESTLIEKYINAPELLRGLDRANVTELADVAVSLEDFRTLADSRSSLTPTMMDAMMALFRHRDAELFDLHKQANEKDRYYKARDRTTYISATNAEVSC